MLASAQRVRPGVNVVKLDGCSQFVLWDRPDALPPLALPAERPAARA
jgi:hypothetical protein